MAVTLKTTLDRLPVERRRRVEARADELIAEEMSSRELRKAMRKTQVAARPQDRQACPGEGPAKAGVAGDVVAPGAAVGHADFHAERGRPRPRRSPPIVAELPNRPPVYLTGLADLSGTSAEQRLPGRVQPRRRTRRGRPKHAGKRIEA